MSLRPDCIFQIHQLWQSDFSGVYSNSCCSCSFEAEIIKIGQSSYKMYSNNILNFQESTTILNTCTKKVWKLIEYTTYLHFNHFIALKDSICHGNSKYQMYSVISIVSWLILWKYQFCLCIRKMNELQRPLVFVNQKVTEINLWC